MLDPSLTAEEVPDEVINVRPFLRAANRWVLRTVGMTAAEYDALPEDDERREIFEEAVIIYCTIQLVPIVAQLVEANANGLLTIYQEINWKDRRKQLASSLMDLIAPYQVTPRFYGAVTREKKQLGIK